MFVVMAMHALKVAQQDICEEIDYTYHQLIGFNKSWLF